MNSPHRFGRLALAGVVAYFLAVAVLVLTINTWTWEGRFIPFRSWALSGDEPHYLLVINSLLVDHDLELSNQYANVAEGSWDAGRRARGVPLDHHTILVDQATGHSELWQNVFDRRQRECSTSVCNGSTFRRLVPDFPDAQPRREVPAHPVGFPALVALFLLPWTPSPPDLEPRVNALMQLFAGLGTLFTYLGGRAAGFRRREALLASSLLILASPWLAYSRSFFADLPAGTFLSIAFWSLRKNRLTLAGLAIGWATLLKPVLVLFGVGWCLSLAWEKRPKQALHLAVPWVLTGLGLGAFNLLTSHRVVVAGALAWEWISEVSGLLATLFSPAHGLVPFVPWSVLALMMLTRTGLGRSVVVPIGLYFVVLALNGHQGETCYGPRYWIPILPLLALVTLEGVRQARLGTRALLAVLGVLGVAVAIPGALRYVELWDYPPQTAWKRLR